MPPPPHLLLLLLLLALALLPPTSSDVLSDGIDRAERLQLREEVREMFYHGYESYLANAFPKDELLPLSCTGKDHPDGGWGALTAVDALDTLLVMGNHTEFERIARWATEHVTFDMNKTVSLFETNIRILGGLLSAHQMALDPDRPCFQDPARPYDHGLLRLALDLGERLLPAFETPTGIPYGSVNLRFGVDERESNVTAAATAGTRMCCACTTFRATRFSNRGSERTMLRRVDSMSRMSSVVWPSARSRDSAFARSG